MVTEESVCPFRLIFKWQVRNTAQLKEHGYVALEKGVFWNMEWSYYFIIYMLFQVCAGIYAYVHAYIVMHILYTMCKIDQ